MRGQQRRRRMPRVRRRTCGTRWRPASTSAGQTRDANLDAGEHRRKALDDGLVDANRRKFRSRGIFFEPINLSAGQHLPDEAGVLLEELLQAPFDRSRLRHAAGFVRHAPRRLGPSVKVNLAA